jgi:hypothetical protein
MVNRAVDRYAVHHVDAVIRTIEPIRFGQVVTQHTQILRLWDESAGRFGGRSMVHGAILPLLRNASPSSGTRGSSVGSKPSNDLVSAQQAALE